MARNRSRIGDLAFDAVLREATAFEDNELRALIAHPSDLPVAHDVGAVSGELLVRAARTVLALRIASRLSDELRDLEEPMLEPLRLAVEAARLVIEREALSPKRKPLSSSVRFTGSSNVQNPATKRKVVASF